MNGVNFLANVQDRVSASITSTEAKAQFVRAMNQAKEYIATRLVTKYEDFFSYKETRDLVLGTVNNEWGRMYWLPANYLLSTVTVQAMFDGENWKRLKYFDLNQYRSNTAGDDLSRAMMDVLGMLDSSGSFADATTDETTILANFSDDTPVYTFINRHLWLFTGSAITAVTNGLKIIGNVFPTDFATATLTQSDDLSIPQLISGTQYTVPVPRELHNDLLVYTSKLIKDLPENKEPLTDEEVNIKALIEQTIASMNPRQRDTAFVPRVQKLRVMNTGRYYE